ncbi:Related to opine oxidase, subunit A [Desulfamplus magnetovallimortis]|uniref:Related to opine oxidase, subunit A n=1 Tax=Desulfamplus magnetovallimortis TaxID=1246637 RepID=A0A1W1HAJ5_9BACT|nr:NAD(P)/FAD-dependent oxidoreductase [Desulfamplus magnetovallimortis]SLM29466.1 Related to opine oxidase, subunit A [Desulfamplus magnetovallimortis]
MSRHVDVIVVGAGPAGLSASSTLAEMGLDVVTLDEQPQLGGQIYRNIEKASPKSLHLFGEDYSSGLMIAERFRKSGADYENSTSVWQLDSDGTICCSSRAHSRQMRANHVIVATGAMERPVPIPGWTLPGVMGAGAVNNLTKESGLKPSGNVVLAGSGPLLLLEATLLIKKNVEIAAILDTTPLIPRVSAVPPAPKALMRTDFLLKGASMLKSIKDAGIPHHRGVKDICAIGTNCLESVQARCGKETITIPADLLMLHFGVIPNSHIFRQAGCRMAWKADQRYWHPACDQWGRTNFERIFAAGDGAMVSGGVSARYRGELTALEVSRCLGIISGHERDALAKPLKKALRHDGWPRPFVDAIYAPRPEQFSFDDATILCRCENVTVKDVRRAVREGARDLNEIKIMTRSGMGSCQGRMCGPALAEIAAAEISLSPDRLGLLNVRPPLRPVPLEEIAEMELETAKESSNWLLDNKK